MHERSLAISILQRARDALSERLSQRIIESQREIEEDAQGGSYLSEIEAIYDQIGARLAHLNAMLTNLPPETPQPAPGAARSDAAASEIVYADLASGRSSPLDLEAAPPARLGLPAPAPRKKPAAEPLVEMFASIVIHAQAGDVPSAARVIAELFDIKPSQARRGAQAFRRQMQQFPELALRIEALGAALKETNDYAAATLLADCFEFQAIDALALVRALKSRKSQPQASE
ncbi:MAG: hypothetical protein WD063_14260 [Pirellulales bacterium]